MNVVDLWVVVDAAVPECMFFAGRLCGEGSDGGSGGGSDGGSVAAVAVVGAVVVVGGGGGGGGIEGLTDNEHTTVW